MQPRSIKKGFLLAVTGAICFALTPATAQNLAESYKGQLVRFITMGSAGGGYDTYMRTIIPFFERETGAKVVPVNEPGAGGLNAMNRILQAPADGYTLLLTSGEGTASAQLYGVKAVNYDIRKLNWLAQVSGEPKVVLVADDFKYKTFQDALKANHTFIWGASGRTSGNTDYCAILSHVLGFNSRIILGYKGSGGMNLAIQRGEIDARVLTSEAAAKFVRGGKLRVILNLARERPSQFPDVPTVYEIGDLSPKMVRWLDWRATLTALGRVIIAAPGTPQAKVGFLRSVMKEVLTDPAYIETARKRRLNPAYLDGASVEKLVRDSMELLNAQEIAEVKKVAMEKYYRK